MSVESFLERKRRERRQERNARFEREVRAATMEELLGELIGMEGLVRREEPEPQKSPAFA